MLGELNEPLRPIQQADFLARNRRELKTERDSLRASVRNELRKSCQQNFVDVEPENLEALYDDILSQRCDYRLPLQEFVWRVGQPSASVLKGGPAHATVHLSL